MIYLDNAATSFPKPGCVLDAVQNCLKYYCGNPGRSAHSLSLAAAERIYECRETLADFIGLGNPENICFTQNATHALNIAIKGYVCEKMHCIISDIEHNSVIRPLIKSLKRYSGEYSVYDTDKPLSEAIIPLIRDDTRIIVTSLASNVTGKVQDLNELSKIAKRYNLRLVLDASQYVGHRKLDLSSVYWDALCAPGHKALFGLQGSGFIAFREGCDIDTLMEGGSGSDSFDEEMPILPPERFEAGTLATPAIVGLCSGISFLRDYGMQSVENKYKRLTERMLDILSSIEGVKTYGCNNGIASFNLRNIPSSVLSDELNREQICTRGGIHCAPLIHKKMGTERSGALRVSLSVLNTDKELDKLYRALLRISYLS